METRAAANDPALADPVAARRKVAHGLGLTQDRHGYESTERRVQRALPRAGRGPVSPAREAARGGVDFDDPGAAPDRGATRRMPSPPTTRSPTRARQRRGARGQRSGPGAVCPPRAAIKCAVDLLEPMWMPLPALVSAVETGRGVGPLERGSRTRSPADGPPISGLTRRRGCPSRPGRRVRRVRCSPTHPSQMQRTCRRQRPARASIRPGPRDAQDADRPVPRRRHRTGEDA